MSDERCPCGKAATQRVPDRHEWRCLDCTIVYWAGVLEAHRTGQSPVTEAPAVQPAPPSRWRRPLSLSAADVVALRQARAAGASIRALSLRFHVSKGHVSDIIRRLARTDVA